MLTFAPGPAMGKMFLAPRPDEYPARTFKRWLIYEFGRYFPSKSMMALHAVMHSGGVTPTHLVDINFPMDHLQNLRNRAGGLESPLLNRWLTQRQPMVFCPERLCDWPGLNPRWLASFRKYGLDNAAVHGRLDHDRSVATYFSFYGLSDETMETAQEVLDTWIDELHERMVECIEDTYRSSHHQWSAWDQLTQRERDIARAVSHGASNQIIAERLGLRESTVKTYMSKILNKLELRSRTELCALVNECPVDGMRWLKVMN